MGKRGKRLSGADFMPRYEQIIERSPREIYAAIRAHLTHGNTSNTGG